MAEQAVHIADLKWTEAVGLTKRSAISERLPMGSAPLEAFIQLDLGMGVLTHAQRHFSKGKPEVEEVKLQIEPIMGKMQADAGEPVANILKNVVIIFNQEAHTNDQTVLALTELESVTEMNKHKQKTKNKKTKKTKQQNTGERDQHFRPRHSQLAPYGFAVRESADGESHGNTGQESLLATG